MRLKIIYILFIVGVSLIWPLSLRAEVVERNTGVGAFGLNSNGQCFSRDECRNLYNLRARDTTLSSSTMADYSSFMKKYGNDFIERVWGEQPQICGKEDAGFCYAPPPVVRLSVNIPGLGGSVQGLSEYISSIYKFGVYSAGILAVFLIIIAGYKWLLARGDMGKISAAKTMIAKAVTGLVLLLFSFTILNIINPNLTTLSFKGPPLFRGIGISGVCRPKAPLKSIEVKDKADNNTYILGEDGSITGIRDTGGKILPINEETPKPTCGRKYVPADTEKYGFECIGDYCPGGLQCFGELCSANILSGRLYTQDRIRYIESISIYRSVSESDNASEVISKNLSENQTNFRIELLDMASKLLNMSVERAMKEGKLTIGDAGTLMRIHGTWVPVTDIIEYQNLLKDKDNPEARYYFKVEVNESNAIDDDYFVDSDCRPFNKTGDEPAREQILLNGVLSPGGPPFFMLNCNITKEDFPVQ